LTRAEIGVERGIPGMDFLSHYIDAACEAKMSSDNDRRARSRFYCYTHGLAADMHLGVKQSTWSRFIFLWFLFAMLMVDHTVNWVLWLVSMIFKYPFALAEHLVVRSRPNATVKPVARENYSGSQDFVEPCSLLENKNTELFSEFAEFEKTGMRSEHALAMLILYRWKLDCNEHSVAWATKLVMNLGEKEAVLKMLLFAEENSLTEYVTRGFLADQLHAQNGVLYYTAAPFTEFALRFFEEIRGKMTFSSRKAQLSLEAANFASLIAPIDLRPWLMLNDFKNDALSIPGDNREHFMEGIAHSKNFLDNSQYVSADLRIAVQDIYQKACNLHNAPWPQST